MTPLVQIEDLNIQFTGGKKPVQAVSGVSLSVRPGEAVALIGESGSGKSVTLRTLLRLHPERKTSMKGKVQVASHDVLALRERELPGFRGKTCAMIFQDPLLALDPVYPVGAQIVEAIRRHEPQTSKAEAEARALQLFERVSIPSPAQRLKAYPHEMSGGMRQRAKIALALACNPQVLLADEPTTALDATVQIQILLLLRELQRDLGLGIIFVTHDIGAAVEVADRIAVMYAGRIVEEGTAEQLIRSPRHPYTIALLQSRFTLIGAAVHKIGECRRGEALCLCKHEQKQQKSEHEVHERAGTEDQKPLPCRLARERARIIDRLILARHGAKAADWQAATA